MSIDGLKNKIWFRGLLGFIGAVVTSLIVLLVLAAVAFFIGANSVVVGIFNVFVRLIASCVCSFIIADGRRALLNGLTSATATFLGVCLVFWLFGGGCDILSALCNFAFILIFCVIFSIIFVNFKKSHNN